MIDTNLTGTFNYTRAVIGELIRRGGSIVNVTSASGVTGMAGQTNYSASKAGVIGFTKALAKEVVRFEVRVNAIAPGFIETDMTASIDEATRKKLYAQIPMGKAGLGAGGRETGGVSCGQRRAVRHRAGLEYGRRVDLEGLRCATTAHASSDANIPAVTMPSSSARGSADCSAPTCSPAAA